MWNSVVLGLKPDTDWGVLLSMIPGVLTPGGRVELVSSVRVGKEDDEIARIQYTEQALSEAKERLEGDGFEVSVHTGIVAASPGMEIIRVAKETASELIIIGLAKRSRVGKALMGSDSQRVLLDSEVPVLARRVG